jgi:hypothetical protein
MARYYTCNGSYKKNSKSVLKYDSPISLRNEYECILLHVNTIEELEKMSRESGFSYEFIISESLKAWAEKRRIENRKKYAVLLNEIEKEERRRTTTNEGEQEEDYGGW